jgi:hypothetical protein
VDNVVFLEESQRNHQGIYEEGVLWRDDPIYALDCQVVLTYPRQDKKAQAKGDCWEKNLGMRIKDKSSRHVVQGRS